ncbi:hypothetical protein DFH11DRAFT_1686758 [Phellopilus nigrolimitatus]|nr:hypothetical protein DFH11DRAFT_1686758 [Phellopilus nigrolimitatus]
MALSDRLPTYLSPRAADVVLSEIRPTKLAPEALRSVNVLLDELLWMILGAARSLSTETIKGGMNKILPTPAGKEALLEAEVELRAYWERTTPSTPLRPYAESVQDFPLLPAFELLRLKCEAYFDKRWQTKVAGVNGFPSHNVQYIAPAALYLTAIIEHVLTNTGRVASRDSSRSTATLQDLYVALCEDDTIFGLFKNMKVHNQIEQQSKALANRPRSKSVQRSVSDHAKGSSRTTTSSPFGSVSAFSDGTQTPLKPRASSESASSGTAIVPSAGSRNSIEKSKAKKLFGRISIDKEGGSLNGGHNSADISHKRSASLISNGKRSISAYDDGPGTSPSEVEFDELMRSGSTMKVSLTPDRLRTFEVYNKERGRGAMNKIVIPASTTPPQPTNKPPLQDSSAINSAADAPTVQTLKNGLSQQQRQVDAIVEDQEMDIQGNGMGGNDARTRKQPKAVPPVSFDAPPSSRMRSTSASQSSISPLGNRQGLARKGSLNALAVESLHSQSLRGVPPTKHTLTMSESVLNTMPAGRRVQQPVNRDSIDDILDASSDEDHPVKKGTGRRRAPTGVSTQTADLISFLQDGPPDLPKAMLPPASPTSVSTIDNKKRSRLRSIVSRLKGKTSTEKLSSQPSLDDLPGHIKRSFSHPPPAFVPPPLSAKNLFAGPGPKLRFPAPPVPPVSIPLSPPSSPSQAVGNSAATSSNRQKLSPISTRKAVPAFAQSVEACQGETNAVSSSAPSMADVPPPTPSKVDSETDKAQPRANSPADDIVTSSSKVAISSPARVSSINAPPPLHAFRPLSKQSQRQAFTPPSTPSAFASHAGDLRRLMSKASTADECRLLVDMFLAQSGIPVRPSEFLPDPVAATNAQQELAIVEALLSNGDESVEKFREKAPSVEVYSDGGQDMGAPPTPHSDEDYHRVTVFRKTVSDVHTVPLTQTVISAEA